MFKEFVPTQTIVLGFGLCGDDSAHGNNILPWRFQSISVLTLVSGRIAVHCYTQYLVALGKMSVLWIE